MTINSEVHVVSKRSNRLFITPVSFLTFVFCPSVFFPTGTIEKPDKMAQTNPMPMGPWKVSVWCI